MAEPEAIIAVMALALEAAAEQVAIAKLAAVMKNSEG
jgi:hypothetical protein